MEEGPIDRKVGTFGFDGVGGRVRRSAAADIVSSRRMARTPRGLSVGRIGWPTSTNLIPGFFTAMTIRGGILGWITTFFSHTHNVESNVL